MKGIISNVRIVVALGSALAGTGGNAGGVNAPPRLWPFSDDGGEYGSADALNTALSALHGCASPLATRARVEFATCVVALLAANIHEHHSAASGGGPVEWVPATAASAAVARVVLHHALHAVRDGMGGDECVALLASASLDAATIARAASDCALFELAFHAAGATSSRAPVFLGFELLVAEMALCGPLSAAATDTSADVEETCSLPPGTAFVSCVGVAICEWVERNIYETHAYASCTGVTPLCSMLRRFVDVEARCEFCALSGMLGIQVPAVVCSAVALPTDLPRRRIVLPAPILSVVRLRLALAALCSRLSPVGSTVEALANVLAAFVGLFSAEFLCMMSASSTTGARLRLTIRAAQFVWLCNSAHEEVLGGACATATRLLRAIQVVLCSERLSGALRLGDSIDSSISASAAATAAITAAADVSSGHESGDDGQFQNAVGDYDIGVGFRTLATAELVEAPLAVETVRTTACAQLTIVLGDAYSCLVGARLGCRGEARRHDAVPAARPPAHVLLGAAGAVCLFKYVTRAGPTAFSAVGTRVPAHKALLEVASALDPEAAAVVEAGGHAAGAIGGHSDIVLLLGTAVGRLQAAFEKNPVFACRGPGMFFDASSVCDFAAAAGNLAMNADAAAAPVPPADIQAVRLQLCSALVETAPVEDTEPLVHRHRDLLRIVHWTLMWVVSVRVWPRVCLMPLAQRLVQVSYAADNVAHARVVVVGPSLLFLEYA